VTSKGERKDERARALGRGVRVSRKPVSAIMLILLLTSMLTLAFNIQPAKASGTIYIRADGSIDPADAPISTPDKTTYTLTGNVNDPIVIERNNTILDGAGFTVNGTNSLNTKGISLTSVENVTIRNISVRFFSRGISENLCHGCHIVETNLSSDGYGIYFQRSHFNTIGGNIITKNSLAGIYLESSNNNTISSNELVSNTIMANGIGGIRLGDMSNYNIIVDNTIANNTHYGIYIEGSYQNSIFHDNLANNNIQAFVASDSQNNVWDNGYPSGGNYWSDYTDADSDHDGIGDAPYVSDTNNVDRYPLMHPYGSIQNLNTSLVYLTIQSAIDVPETEDEHTIFVRSGTYYENVVVDKTLSLVGEDKSATIIDGNQTENVVIVTASNTRISDFTIQNSGNVAGDVGVYLFHVSNCLLSRCRIVNNNEGVRVGGGSGAYNVIVENEVNDNNAGVTLVMCAYNSIVNNTITNNTHWTSGWGICLADSYQNTVSSNIIVQNSNGIWVDTPSFNPTGNEISKNYIAENSHSGVLLQYSHGNYITANKFFDNSRSISFEVYCDDNIITENTIENSIYGIDFVQSNRNNQFYHNNFINNTVQVHPEGTNSTWDDGYPSGGNYWSNYAGSDIFCGAYQNETGSDNIGDSPYVIDANNVDNYPLMRPYVPFDNETIYIRADGSVDPSGAPIAREGDLYTLSADITTDADGIVVERDCITLDGGDYNVQGRGIGAGIRLFSRNGITAERLKVSDFLQGFSLSQSSGNYIIRNEVSHAGYAIDASGSNNNSIIANLVSDTEDGIFLSGSSNHTISENILANNINYGIYMGHSFENTLSKNRIVNSIQFGIEMDECSFNTVSENDILSSGIGMYLFRSVNNSICLNNLDSNECGVQLKWGSSDNRFYHNNFSNTQQVRELTDYAPYVPSINVWDDGYPSGGNHWSDYNGTDLYSELYQNETGSDGIGDTPYVIDADNQDNYPLMRPYVPFDNQTIYIRADGNVDPSGAPILQKGNSYRLLNNITTGSDGIVVERDNIIFDGGYSAIKGTSGANGIDLTNRSNVTVLNCRVESFGLPYGGIWLLNSHNITLCGNILVNNGYYGIRVGGTNNSLVENVIMNTEYDGIYMQEAVGNTVCGNTIENSGIVGIVVMNDCSDNLFIFNNLISNSLQAYSHFSVNTWDNGCEGNFWSDYNGTDLYHGVHQNETGSDGIGDSPYVIDANNEDSFPLMKTFPWSEHDVGITYIGRVYSFDLVVPLKTVVGLGFSLNISTFVMNYGNQSETFDVQVYANDTLVGTFANVTLESRQSVILNLRWNTMGIAYGNYTISAYAQPVLGETNIADNNFTGGWVIVSMVGDITGPDGWPDGKCDIRDVSAVARLFGVNSPNPEYKPNCDINNDWKIDIKDVSTVARHFGEHV